MPLQGRDCSRFQLAVNLHQCREPECLAWRPSEQDLIVTSRFSRLLFKRVSYPAPHTGRTLDFRFAKKGKVRVASNSERFLDPRQGNSRQRKKKKVRNTKQNLQRGVSCHPTADPAQLASVASMQLDHSYTHKFHSLVTHLQSQGTYLLLLRVSQP